MTFKISQVWNISIETLHHSRRNHAWNHSQWNHAWNHSWWNHAWNHSRWNHAWNHSQWNHVWNHSRWNHAYVLGFSLPWPPFPVIARLQSMSIWQHHWLTIDLLFTMIDFCNWFIIKIDFSLPWPPFLAKARLQSRPILRHQYLLLTLFLLWIILHTMNWLNIAVDFSLPWPCSTTRSNWQLPYLLLTYFLLWLTGPRGPGANSMKVCCCPWWISQFVVIHNYTWTFWQESLLTWFLHITKPHLHHARPKFLCHICRQKFAETNPCFAFVAVHDSSDSAKVGQNMVFIKEEE